MFVVKRPFKSLGKTYVAGSVITEPASIKRFKGKLAEGKIIEVTEQTYDNAASYFKSKFGVDIPPLTDAEEQQNVEEQVTRPEGQQDDEEQQNAEVQVVKPEVKVQAVQVSAVATN